MKITLYTNPGCPPCKAVQKWLDKNHPEYKVVDLSIDTDAKSHLIDLNYRTTPVTEVEFDEYVERIPGFSIEKLTKAILNHI